MNQENKVSLPENYTEHPGFHFAFADEDSHVRLHLDEYYAIRQELHMLRESLKLIAESEPIDTGTVVCDFDTLQCVAINALKNCTISL